MYKNGREEKKHVKGKEGKGRRKDWRKGTDRKEEKLEMMSFWELLFLAFEEPFFCLGERRRRGRGRARGRGGRGGGRTWVGWGRRRVKVGGGVSFLSSEVNNRCVYHLISHLFLVSWGFAFPE